MQGSRRGLDQPQLLCFDTKSTMTFDPLDVDRGLLDRLNKINNTLTVQWNRLQNIRNTVDDTGTQADRARSRVRDAETLIHQARQELDKAKDAVAKVVSDTSLSWQPLVFRL